jgi:transcriptional regulator with XRE-family HTH domain
MYWFPQIYLISNVTFKAISNFYIVKLTLNNFFLLKVPSMITGSKLRRFRKIKDFSIKEMANKLGMDESSYARLERGITKITTEKEERVLQTFGITHEFLDSIENTLNYTNNFHDYSNGNFHNQQVIIEKNDDLLKSILSTLSSIEAQAISQAQLNVKLIESLEKLISKK